MSKIVHIDKLFKGYLEGTLTTAQNEKVKSHLVFCRPCRLALEELKKQPPTQPSEKPPEKTFKAPAVSASGFRIGGLVLAAVLILVLLKWGPQRHSAQEAVPPEPVLTPTLTPTPVVEVPAPVVEPPPVEPPPEVVEDAPAGSLDLKGQKSGIEEPAEMVIRSASELKNVWKKHVKNETAPPPVPNVNFETDSVIAVFGGEIVDIEQTTWEGFPARIVSLKTTPQTLGPQNFHFKTTSKQSGRTFFRKNR